MTVTIPEVSLLGSSVLDEVQPPHDPSSPLLSFAVSLSPPIQLPQDHPLPSLDLQFTSNFTSEYRVAIDAD